MLCSLGFVVVALLEFAIIILIGRNSETHVNGLERRNPSDKTVRRRSILEKKKGKYVDGLSGIHRKIEAERCQEVTVNVENRVRVNQSINTIDLISFWLFLTCFVVFNIGYWKYY